jgi:hypothetical protein
LDAKGRPFQTTDEGLGSAFVYGTDGKLYVMNDHQVGLIHHSTLSAGAAVRLAGQIWIKNGRVVKISTESGHYRPDEVALTYGLLGLKRAELDLSRANIAPEVREEIRFLERLQSFKDLGKMADFARREALETEDDRKASLSHILAHEIVYRIHAGTRPQREAYRELLHDYLKSGPPQQLNTRCGVIFDEALAVGGGDPALSIALLKEMGFSRTSALAWVLSVKHAARDEPRPQLARRLRAPALREFRRKIAPYLEDDRLDPEITAALEP